LSLSKPGDRADAVSTSSTDGDSGFDRLNRWYGDDAR